MTIKWYDTQDGDDGSINRLQNYRLLLALPLAARVDKKSGATWLPGYGLVGSFCSWGKNDHFFSDVNRIHCFIIPER